MNDKYQNLKNFKKIHSYLTEAAMRWNTLNGCYPSVSQFSSFINEHMEENLLSFNNTEELNENHIRTITNKLVHLFEDAADKFGNMTDAQFEDWVSRSPGARQKAEALRAEGKRRKEAQAARNSGTAQGPRDPRERAQWQEASAQERARGRAERARQQWKHNQTTAETPPQGSGQPPRPTGVPATTPAAESPSMMRSVGKGAKAVTQIGLGIPLAIGADIALDKPAETVAKAFGAEEPETVEKTKEVIKSPGVGFASMLPFGLKMAGKGALSGLIQTGADFALDKPAKAAAEFLGAKGKDIEDDAETLKAPITWAAGGAPFGPAGVAVGLGIGSAIAGYGVGKKLGKTIWGDEETWQAQDDALDAERARVRRLRNPDEQEKLGITPEQAEERIKAGAPPQGGEFLGQATAGNITGETAKEREEREKFDKEMSRNFTGSTRQMRQDLATATKPFTDVASQQSAQSVLDSPFYKQALERSRERLNEFAIGGLARAVAPVVAKALPAVERAVAPAVERVATTTPRAGRLAGRIDSMIDDVVNLSHEAPETAAGSFPANKTAPDFAPPLTTPKPYRRVPSPVEPLPFAEPAPTTTPPEIEIPTIQPLVPSPKPAPTPKPSPMEPLPFAEPAPRTTPLEIEPVRPTKPLVPSRKPQTGMVPAIDTELETLTSSPLAAPITSPITKTSPLTAPITNTGVSTQTALSTATGRQTRAITQARTQTKTQTKTRVDTSARTPVRTRTKTGIPFPTGGFGGQSSDTDNTGFVDSPIPVNIAPGERRGAMKRAPIQMFDGSWTTSPTTVNEGKLSEKESLKRKLTKQKYKIVYVQEGKKVEVFASSIRGVRRAVYGKKQFRVYNSSGSDLTGYFKKLIKK